MTNHHQLHTAFIYENSVVVSSTVNADLKEPLIDVQDLESLSSQDENQLVDVARRRLSNHALVKSFCLGSFVGLLLQAVTFSAYLVITTKWGKNRPPEESGVTLSYWTLYLLIHIDIAVYSIIWGGFIAVLTRKGSMYLRKTFDNDADAPNTESVWTPRFLFLSGIAFTSCLLLGSDIAWEIIDIKLGLPLSLAPLLFTLLLNLWRCCLMIKYFDWIHEIKNPEDDDEEDSFFV
jgi:hypothetical protein